MLNSSKFNSRFDYYYSDDGFLSNILQFETTIAFPVEATQEIRSRTDRYPVAERQIARRVIKDGMKYV